MSENEKLEALMASNPELKALVESHRNLDKKLEEMNNRPYLSPEDEMERKRMQKEKLALKDKISAFTEGK